MERLVVDFAALGEVADSLAQDAEETEQLLAALKRQMTALRAAWEGSAADGFAATFDAWFQAAAELHEQLGYIHTFTVSAHGNHAHAVQTNARIWRG